MLLFALATSGCAVQTAREPCGAEALHDADITTSVRAILEAHPGIPTSDITVQTVNCKVYLYGIVDTDLERLTAVDLARQVSGVRGVVDSLGVRGGVY